MPAAFCIRRPLTRIALRRLVCFACTAGPDVYCQPDDSRNRRPGQ